MSHHATGNWQGTSASPTRGYLIVQFPVDSPDLIAKLRYLEESVGLTAKQIVDELLDYYHSTDIEILSYVSIAHKLCLDRMTKTQSQFDYQQFHQFVVDILVVVNAELQRILLQRGVGELWSFARMREDDLIIERRYKKTWTPKQLPMNIDASS